MTFLLLLAACSVGGEGPATPGSASADLAAATGEIAGEAREVARLAAELTALVDESRRQVESGASTREAEIAKMRTLMRQIEERNAALQARWTALEADVHTRAGDVAPPVEEE